MSRLANDGEPALNPLSAHGLTPGLDIELECAVGQRPGPFLRIHDEGQAVAFQGDASPFRWAADVLQRAFAQEQSPDAQR